MSAPMTSISDLVERLADFHNKTPFHDTRAILREAADALTAATKRADEAEAQADRSMDKYLSALKVERQDAADLAFLKEQGGSERDMTHYAPGNAKVHSSGELRGALFLTKDDFRRLAAARARALLNQGETDR